MLMGGRIRFWIIAASVVGLAALAAVSWLSYRNAKELIAANQRLARAHKLIEDLTRCPCYANGSFPPFCRASTSSFITSSRAWIIGSSS